MLTKNLGYNIRSNSINIFLERSNGTLACSLLFHANLDSPATINFDLQTKISIKVVINQLSFIGVNFHSIEEIVIFGNANISMTLGCSVRSTELIVAFKREEKHLMLSLG